MSIYIHHGSNEFVLSEFNEIKNQLAFPKPKGGLWASPIGTCFGWEELNKNNLLPKCDMTKSFRFKLSDNANVFMINSICDLNKLPKLEQNCNPWVRLDFEKIVSNGTDALQLNLSGIDEEDKKKELSKALDGWECDSILVMNKDIIKAID